MRHSSPVSLPYAREHPGSAKTYLKQNANFDEPNDGGDSVNGLARVDDRGVCFVGVPIKFSVGVRHALIAPQSYDVRVHVCTYSKVVSNIRH